jgi:hypothetical protein
MNKLRLLKERMEWGKYTLDDLDYLKKVLNAVVDGRDANDAFHIQPSSRGVKRSDFPAFLKIMRAFHMISGAIDRTVFQEDDGKYYASEGQAEKLLLKSAVLTAAETYGIDAESLARYWTMPEYQDLKNICMSGDWL